MVQVEALVLALKEVVAGEKAVEIESVDVELLEAPVVSEE